MGGDSSAIGSAQWNRAETQVMLTTGDGHVFRYWVDQRRLLAAACKRLPMNFTWSNWHRYFSGQPYRCTCSDLPPHPTVLEAVEAGRASFAEASMCAATE